MISIAFIGDAQNPHFPKWLSALCEQGISIDFLSYDAPLKPIQGVTFHQIPLPFGQKRGWYNFHLAAIKPFQDVLNVLSPKPQLLIGSFGTNYGYLALRTGFKPFILQTWTRDLTIAPFEGMKRFFYHSIMQKALDYADLVITDGAALAEIGQKRFPSFAEKIKPIRWGIRLADFTSSPEKCQLAHEQWLIPTDAFVLTNGRGIFEWYNPELTLPALQNWVEQHTTHYAVILTNAHERTEAIQNKLNEMKLHPQIRVIDERLSIEEVSKIWAMTDGMISIPKFDGISEAILEAMFSGAIPLVNDIPSNRSFLKDHESAFFVDTTSPESLAQSFLHFSQTPLDKRQSMMKRNRLFVETEASIEGSATLLADYIRELISTATK